VNPKPLGIGTLYANKIDNIALEKIISVFLINSKIKNDKKDISLQQLNFILVSQFHFLMSVENELRIVHTEYRQYFDTITKEWNFYWQQLTEFFKNNIAENSKFLSEIQGQGIQESNNILEAKTVINQLLEITRSEFVENPQNNYAKNLHSIFQRQQKLIADWESGVDCYANFFEEIAQRIELSYKTLADTKHIIDTKTKLKCLLTLQNTQHST
jgi:hypothetical protein